MVHISGLVDGTRIAMHTCFFLLTYSCFLKVMTICFQKGITQSLRKFSITLILPHLESLGDIINVLDPEQAKSHGDFLAYDLTFRNKKYCRDAGDRFHKGAC